MKNLSVFLLAIPLLFTFSFSFSQNTHEYYGRWLSGTLTLSDSLDCSNWITTDWRSWTPPPAIEPKKSVSIMVDGFSVFDFNLMRLTAETIVISAIVSRAYGTDACIKEDAKMHILFTDSSMLVLSNDLDRNCEGKFGVFFGGSTWGNKESALNELLSKRIASMRVYTKDGYVEKDFPAWESHEFFRILNCVFDPLPYEYRCAYCEGFYIIKQIESTRYCSNRCQQQAYLERNGRQCVGCNKWFVGRKLQRYCTKQCSN